MSLCVCGGTAVLPRVCVARAAGGPGVKKGCVCMGSGLGFSVGGGSGLGRRPELHYLFFLPFRLLPGLQLLPLDPPLLHGAFTRFPGLSVWEERLGV